MQRTQLKRKMCKSCQKTTKFERHVTANGCGDLLLVFATFGLWVIVREMFKAPYRCAECGSK